MDARLAGLAPGDDFDRFRDPTRTRRTPTSAWRPAAASSPRPLPAGSRAAATAAHLRDHGTGPWGAPGQPRVRCSLPPTRVGADRSGVTVCMHVRGRQRHRRVHDRRAARRTWPTGRRCASSWRRAARASASTCPPSRAPPPARPRSCPLELSGEELWHAADALRQLVEADPDALLPASGTRSRRSRTSCGPRPTTCSSTRPAGPRWAASWGARALACARGPASPNRVGRGGTLRHTRHVCSYSPRGMS